MVNIVDDNVSRTANTIGSYRRWVVQDKEVSATRNLQFRNNTLDIVSNADYPFFGLIYFVRGTSHNLMVDNNILRRSGATQEAQMLLVDIPLDSTSKITNNFMESDVFNSIRGLDLRMIDTPAPILTNNLHSSGQTYPELNQ